MMGQVKNIEHTEEMIKYKIFFKNQKEMDHFRNLGIHRS